MGNPMRGADPGATLRLGDPMQGLTQATPGVWVIRCEGQT